MANRLGGVRWAQPAEPSAGSGTDQLLGLMNDATAQPDHSEGCSRREEGKQNLGGHPEQIASAAVAQPSVSEAG